MSAPSVLERCRMALAEIGLDPNLAAAGAPGTVILPTSLTTETAWLASVTISWPARNICLPCHEAGHAAAVDAWPDRDLQHAAIDAAWDACGAWRPFQRESCGAQP